MAVDASSLLQQLFQQLSHVLDASSDGSHDISHLNRVWRAARLIAEEEGGDLRLLAAAVLLHDCVTVEKDSPLRGQAARLSAEKAEQLLKELHWSSVDIETVSDAIRTHSYSAGLTPKSPEGRILQDADRLDAIGAVGIARCFYTAGRMGSMPSTRKGKNGTWMIGAMPSTISPGSFSGWRPVSKHPLGAGWLRKGIPGCKRFTTLSQAKSMTGKKWEERPVVLFNASIKLPSACCARICL
jgi:hypothetical protein